MKAISYQQLAVSEHAHLCGAAVLASILLLSAISTAAQSVAAAPAYREVTDEAGRVVRVPVDVRRIVSLAPNMTETVYALGAQDRLVGVTTYCDYPPEAAVKEKVGGPLSPSLEQIVALRPDVVLAAKTANRRETLEALERLGVAVYGTNPKSVEEVLDSTLRVADAIGARAQGAALVAQLRARLAALKQRLSGRPPRRVLFVVWHDPLISVGRNTFLADALRWAGAEPAVESDREWPQLNLEEVLRVQPDFLVFASAHAGPVKETVDDLRARPGWRNLEAIRQNRVAVISEAVNRPGPRLVPTIEELARQLHPAAFGGGRETGKRKMETRNTARADYFPFSNFHFPGVAKEGTQCSH